MFCTVTAAWLNLKNKPEVLEKHTCQGRKCKLPGVAQVARCITMKIYYFKSVCTVLK